MQNETSLYDIPAERMVYTHEQLGAGRELGEAEIVNTIWGKARVRIIQKQGKSGWTWLLTALVALAAIAAAWYLVARLHTESSTPPQVAEPLEASPPKATAENTPGQSNSDNPAGVTTPAPANVAGTAVAPAPAVPSPLNTEKPQPAAEKPQPVASRQTKTAPTESHAQPRLSAAKSEKHQPASAPSPLNTPTADIQAKQPESAGNPAKANSTSESAATDTPANNPPVKTEEPPKNDTTDSHP